MFKYILLWLPMPVIAVLNAVLRELLFVKRYGEKTAHQFSTITIIVFLGVYIYIISSKWNYQSYSQALLTGVIWCLLTLAFEFGLGLATKRTLREMLKAYDLFNGELWVLVPVFMLVSPLLFYLLFQK